jgi:hypothetical protein
MRYVVMAVLLSGGCDAPRKREPEPSPVVSPLTPVRQAPPLSKVEASPSPPTQEARICVAPECGGDFPLTVAGQVKRIDSQRRGSASYYASMRKAYERDGLDIDVYKKISGSVDGFMLYDYNLAAIPTRYLTFRALKKNPAKQAGKPWCTSVGRIAEIKESEGVTTARLTAGDGIDDAILVIGRFEGDFVEGSRVETCGYLAGDFTFKARAGWDMTLPVLAAAGLVSAGGFTRMGEQITRDNRKPQRK